MNVVAEPFDKPDEEDEVMALAEARGWPTIRGLVGGGDDGLHWRRRIRWFTTSQLQEALALLADGTPPLMLKGVTDELVAPGSGSAGARRDAAHASRADGRGAGSPAAPGEPVSGELGPRPAVVGPVAATPASWAYEARQAYLARVLKHMPFLADALRTGGVRTTKDGEPFTITAPLWTGELDSEGLPIPAENPAWLHEVWPVYSGPDPQENKRRSLRDTLIVSPESGPRLVAAGLWTGEYDDAGLPIPTPPAPDRSRR